MRPRALQSAIVAVLSLLAAANAEAITVTCHPPNQKCHIDLVPPHPGSLSFSGSDAVADVEIEMGGSIRSMTWTRFHMSTSDTALGGATIGLDSTRASTGTIQPQGKDPYPATNTMDFFFVVNSPRFGRLISATPIRLQGVINSMPPRGTAYTMINGPVNFYVYNDPTHTTVWRVSAATVTVALPNLGMIGVAVVLALMLLVATWVIVRRRSPSGLMNSPG